MMLRTNEDWVKEKMRSQKARQRWRKACRYGGNVGGTLSNVTGLIMNSSLFAYTHVLVQRSDRSGSELGARRADNAVMIDRTVHVQRARPQLTTSHHHGLPAFLFAMSLASKASKRTFYGSIVFTLLTVAGAHYAQKVESEVGRISSPKYLANRSILASIEGFVVHPSLLTFPFYALIPEYVSRCRKR